MVNNTNSWTKPVSGEGMSKISIFLPEDLADAIAIHMHRYAKSMLKVEGLVEVDAGTMGGALELVDPVGAMDLAVGCWQRVNLSAAAAVRPLSTAACMVSTSSG